MPQRPPQALLERRAEEAGGDDRGERRRDDVPARSSELTTQAMNAPNVTISPWAKFDSPVVPKISDSPIEVMAMIIASFKPLASVCGSRLNLL